MLDRAPMDIVLVFPPQWSPFQPPLSLPALSGWLKRAGYAVASIDANLHFYQWLLSDEFACLLGPAFEGSRLPPEQIEGYRHILSRASEFRAELDALRSLGRAGAGSDVDFLKKHFTAVHALETYLNSLCAVVRDFSITPYSFSLTLAAQQGRTFADLVDDPPDLLGIFADQLVSEQIGPRRPRIVGLSCIGQEQLYFTLLLGSAIRRRLAVPVVVGGTILPRLFESGGLSRRWFGRYFDVVVKNEGERPCEALLRNVHDGRPLALGVPGIVHSEGAALVSAASAPPLKPSELPIPDFDDLPLGQYFSAYTTLPLLSARGCYWGKCEFCHHGMVYGEKYAAYEVGSILDSVRILSERYGVRHFSFNDEAIPPKVARHIGTAFPDADASGWNFTALIKFEKYYTREDFNNLHRIGFRSLYVGLESASERVLSLMRKPNTQDTILRNLRDATAAGIWTHCFLFFGFPGEQEEDAAETYDFVLSHSPVIGSIGCGAFSLEHNAPIFRHPEQFGLELRKIPEGSLSVYYDYELASGIGAERALAWMRALNEAAYAMPKYAAMNWIPREHLLCLLAAMRPDRLIELGTDMVAAGGIGPWLRICELFTVLRSSDPEWPVIAINRLNSRVVKLSGPAADILALLESENAPLAEVRSAAPAFYRHLVETPRIAS
jgi:anaerobic magnesium-protoporphyrin IX monomethyl ester cyclase